MVKVKKKDLLKLLWFSNMAVFSLMLVESRPKSSADILGIMCIQVKVRAFFVSIVHIAMILKYTVQMKVEYRCQRLHLLKVFWTWKDN
nr:hypothetical protein Iba_chr02aCG1550 [Ipomoea batatas]GMC62143.1 hypothetical protein Iba_chr02cCG1080 [Ipomoea batatas]